MSLANLTEKVAKSVATKKAGVKSFKKAYKAAPGETMGHYAKNHRWGVGLTAASFAPIHAGAHSVRRSSHTGIDSKTN